MHRFFTSEMMGVGLGSTSVALPDGVRTTNFGPPWLSGTALSSGFMAALALPNLLAAVDRGKTRRTLSDIEAIAQACEGFSSDARSYPGPTEGWVPVERIAQEGLEGLGGACPVPRFVVRVRQDVRRLAGGRGSPVLVADMLQGLRAAVDAPESELRTSGREGLLRLRIRVLRAGGVAADAHRQRHGRDEDDQDDDDDRERGRNQDLREQRRPHNTSTRWVDDAPLLHRIIAVEGGVED